MDRFCLLKFFLVNFVYNIDISGIHFLLQIRTVSLDFFFDIVFYLIWLSFFDLLFLLRFTCIFWLCLCGLFWFLLDFLALFEVFCWTFLVFQGRVFLIDIGVRVGSRLFFLVSLCILDLFRSLFLFSFILFFLSYWLGFCGDNFLDWIFCSRGFWGRGILNRFSFSGVIYLILFCWFSNLFMVESYRGRSLRGFGLDYRFFRYFWSRFLWFGGFFSLFCGGYFFFSRGFLSFFSRGLLLSYLLLNWLNRSFSDLIIRSNCFCKITSLMDDPFGEKLQPLWWYLWLNNWLF